MRKKSFVVVAVALWSLCAGGAAVAGNPPAPPAHINQRATATTTNDFFRMSDSM